MIYRKTFLTVVLVLILSTLPLSAMAAPPQESGGEDYIVQANDTLSKLASRFYGDVLAYPAIVESSN